MFYHVNCSEELIEVKERGGSQRGEQLKFCLKEAAETTSHQILEKGDKALNDVT